MSTSQLAVPDKPLFTNYLDVFARSTATLLLVVYGVGFVILSAYEAQYGVAQFGPLRARIFLVGAVFSALLMFPIAAHQYGFAYFGPLSKVRENADPAKRFERGVVLAFGFAFTAYWMAAVFGLFLFVYDVPKMPIRHFWIRVLAFVVGLCVLHH